MGSRRRSANGPIARLGRGYRRFFPKTRGLNASPLTIANYREAFCLLIAYAERCLKKPPAKLAVRDLDPEFITRFLDYLERERGNCARTRNIRLAAIHSFFTYAALHEPSAAAIAQRVLAIKSKRFPKKPVDFLTRAESEAVLSGPDQATWSGRRDWTLLLVALQTGLRVSELIGLRCQDVALETGAHLRCTDKGRKTRCIPLRKEVVGALRQWLREPNGQPADAVFTNARGQPLSRDGVQYIVTQHVKNARAKCPTLKDKRVSPHVLRHYADLQTMPTEMGLRAERTCWLCVFPVESGSSARHSLGGLRGS
jgi:integrase/recombinase XerD